jgi:MFS family permease
MLRILLLQTSNFFSGLANSLVAISIPWLVLETTGSPAFSGLVVAAASIPAVIMAPLAGLLIRAFGKRRVSVAADLLSALSVVGFPLLALTVGLSGTLILLLAVVGALFDPVGYTARRTLITTVAESSGFSLDRLNGVHEGLFAVSWIAGPALGAWLIASLGVTNAFWVAGVCFAVAALAILLLRASGVAATAGAAAAQGAGERAGPLLGFRILWEDRLLRGIVVTILIAGTIYLPTESVLLATYYESLAEPASLGLVISAMAAGGAISAFGYGWLIERFSGRALLRLSLVGAASSTLLMALLPPLPLVVAFGFTLGLAWGPFTPLLTSLIQKRVPERTHGLVFGAQSALFYASPPLGMVLTGLAVESFGVPTTYLALGGLLLATALLALLTPALRRSF